MIMFLDPPMAHLTVTCHSSVHTPPQASHEFVPKESMAKVVLSGLYY